MIKLKGYRYEKQGVSMVYLWYQFRCSTCSKILFVDKHIKGQIELDTKYSYSCKCSVSLEGNS